MRGRLFSKTYGWARLLDKLGLESMNFDTCPHCQGLVPAELSACPHCDQAMSCDADPDAPIGKRVAKAAAKVAVAGAAAMTLMACYGGGYYGDDDGIGGPADPTVACNAAQNLTLDVSPNGANYTAFVSGNTRGGFDGFVSCSGTSTTNTPERLFTLNPGTLRGQAGTLSVLIDAERHVVWTADQCDEFTDDEAVCGGNGRLELDVTSLQETTIGVESLSGGGDFQLQVIFEPAAVP